MDGNGAPDGVDEPGINIEAIDRLIRVNRVRARVGVGLGDRPAQRAGVEVVVRVGDVERGRRDAVLQRLDVRAEPGRDLADGAGRAGEQLLKPGPSDHGKSPPKEGWSAIQWEDSEPGAQTVRPGAVWPVRELLGGATSPAALFQPLILLEALHGAGLGCRQSPVTRMNAVRSGTGTS